MLDVLIADYVQAREDERTFLLVIGTLFAIGIPLAASASSLIFKSCSADALAAGTCTETPRWAFAFVPLLPLLLIGLFVLYGAAAVMRSYYLRALEERLAEYGAEIEFPGRTAAAPRRSVSSPGLTGFLLPMVSHRRGVFPNALIQSLLYVVAAVLGAGLCVAAIWRIEDRGLQLIAGAFYVLCGAALATIAIRAGLDARRFLQTLLDKRTTEPLLLPASADERSLGAYLLIPRPLDLAKVSFIASGIVVSYVFAPGLERPSVWLLIAFVLAFELLVYHARYMRNDYRDRGSDPDHPMAASKRRTPRLDGRPDRLVWFEGVFALRLMGAAAFAGWLFLAGHDRLGWIFVAGSAAAWAVGDVYERLKDRAKALRDPPPFPRRSPQLALFAWVGVGYGLRTAIGVAAGSEALDYNWHSVGTVAFILVWGLTFGWMFVAMTWALEASAFVASDRDAYDTRLESRAHIAVLGSEAGLVQAQTAREPNLIANPDRPGRQRSPVLLPRRGMGDTARPRIWSSWNIPYPVAMFFAAFVGFQIAFDWRPSTVGYGAAAAIGVVAAALAVVAVSLRLPPPAHVLLGLAALCGAALIAEAAHAHHIYVAGVALVAVAAWYAMFLGNSYHRLLHPEQVWSGIALFIGAHLERLTLGDGALRAKLQGLQDDARKSFE